MSSLFSIGDDELDLDDEDCLLAACGEESSVNCITDNSKKGSGSEQINQSSSKTQLLRTKEMEKFNSHYSRRPFESLSNINTNDRLSEKKRATTEQVHKSSSFTNTADWQRNNTTSTANGFRAPLAKRFAADNNSSPKPSSGNAASLLRSSSTPAFKNADRTTEMYSSDKMHPCSNSSPVSRNIQTRDSQLQEFAQCNFRLADSHKSSKRLNPLNKLSTPSNSISNFSSKNDMSGFHSPSACTGFQTLHNSKATDVNTNSPVWQQKGPLRCSSGIHNQTRDFILHKGNTSAPLCNQTEGSSTSTLNKSLNGTRTPETPLMFRQRAGAGPSTPQVHQAVTPVVNRSCNRTPSGIKTPTTRKFPGPAGLLPKLSPGQNLDDRSLVSPLPSTRKRSPVENKVHVSQSSTSEDDDFNRDPWTYMHQDFLKNVPLAKRYTIIRVYTEAIQQRLDHGKVPCLCALVKAFSLTEADASVLLKDPTGEIHGTLHRKVLEDFQSELAPGAGLILKHVSVFSPAPRKHYLNITPGNILQIYPPDPQYMSSSQSLASQCTQAGNKREEQRVVIEDEVVSEQEANTTDERTAIIEKEEEWVQKDCFEDLLEGLDDDEDFLDEALLV
ncbi:uncharacterized protein LOC144660357 [Oculina patagonica]